LSSLSHKQGTTDNDEAPSSLPSCTPQPLSSPHEQGKTNNAKALSSALPLLPLPSLSHEQGAINGVQAPLPLPSCALLPLPSLHKQGATDSAEAPLLSMREQGTADKFKCSSPLREQGVTNSAMVLLTGQPPLLLLRKQGTTNNAQAPSSMPPLLA
jgi:hypothetical protein